MPGYGYSGRPNTTGWDPVHIASVVNFAAISFALLSSLQYAILGRFAFRLATGDRAFWRGCLIEGARLEIALAVCDGVLQISITVAKPTT